MAIAAIIDERRLERRFDAGYLGEIDIALELLALGGFEIKLLDPVPLDDGHPGFFPVACVDQHTHGHLLFSGRAAGGLRRRGRARYAGAIAAGERPPMP